MKNNIVNELLNLLKIKGADIQYGNEDVTQLEHALQCAELAEQNKKSDAFITAALLHDIGHLIYEDKDPIHEGKDGLHEDLGAAYLGLQLLNRENEIFKENPKIQPDLSGYDYLLRRQLKPEAPVKYTEVLKDLKIIPTSMIDISDGLSSEVLHISKSSNVGITIHEEKIPIDYTAINLANEFNLNPITCALSGGEDYELLLQWGRNTMIS